MADTVDANFEAFCEHPDIRDLPKQEQYAAYRRAWNAMIAGKNAGRDESYSLPYYDRIKSKGIKGHKRAYEDMTHATDQTAT